MAMELILLYVKKWLAVKKFLSIVEAKYSIKETSAFKTKILGLENIEKIFPSILLDGDTAIRVMVKVILFLG